MKSSTVSLRVADEARSVVVTFLIVYFVTFIFFFIAGYFGRSNYHFLYLSYLIQTSGSAGLEFSIPITGIYAGNRWRVKEMRKIENRNIFVIAVSIILMIVS